MDILTSASTESKTAASLTGVTEAVFTYLIALKSVKKRGGETENFSADKLASSIRAACRDGGVGDPEAVSRLTERVIGRLSRKFDGHTTPATGDIRETVVASLIDHNLPHVALKYIVFRQQTSDAASGEPVYGQGIAVERRFTSSGIHPYDRIIWEKRDARITNEKGGVIFEQKDVEAPAFYSQTAVNIIVSKYFRGELDTPARETSVRQLMDRVAKTIAGWGRKDGYFMTAEDAVAFEAELTSILVNQMAAFNSPVWFNVGVSPRPQCSACFINSVKDDLRSILNLAVTEGMLFKYGSGAGSNISTLRSAKENLSNSSGKSSGPVSFMKGFDAFAGVIKSGGKTRRAAKMVVLNADHPDIREFISCKAKEEKKAWALVDAGYDGSITGDAYASIFFQNANNSVRATDEFMRAATNDQTYSTKKVTTGEPCETLRAKEVLREISEAAWQCGDPGMQFDTTVNHWNPVKKSGRINASNPCSEYMFLDDSACNLASLNLMKFRRADGEMDIEAFCHASRVVITAMEIIIGNSSYPTPAIEQNSHEFRPLGIGYANLGALLMCRGLAYDSEEGRNYAAAVTALMSGVSYYQSSVIASRRGPFAAYSTNKEPFLEVIGRHREAAGSIAGAGVPQDLLFAARASWDQALGSGREHGFRNAQISLLAPTGTIAFLMDCDTTGIEPDIALIKYKWLVGGGMIKIINRSVPEALHRLGYTEAEIREIIGYIEKNDTIEGAPGLKNEHLSIFDCAFKAAKGSRSIHYMGHIRMMAAVQPFLSGAISKTVNLPNEATVEDIIIAYIESWKMGLKAVAVYRDGSKRQQPLTTTADKDVSKKNKVEADYVPRRRRLPDERRALTHKFVIGSHEGYITVGLYDDGVPGEIFITMNKEGSVISGLMDAFATSVSVGLQYGVPLKVLVNKFAHMRFEPSGYTNNPSIRIAKSIVDYVFRWLAVKFLPAEEAASVGVQIDQADNGEHLVVSKPETKAAGAPAQATIFQAPGTRAANDLTMTFNNTADAPACSSCGSVMVRNASCYKCLNCGETSGCS